MRRAWRTVCAARCKDGGLASDACTCLVLEGSNRTEAPLVREWAKDAPDFARKMGSRHGSAFYAR